MKGIDKRCGCRDETGAKFGARCPLLARSGHGSYGYRIDLGPGLDVRGQFRQRRQEYKGGFAKRRDAERARAEHLARLGQGQARSGRTCGEWWDEWLEGKVKLRLATRRSYEAHVRLYLRPHLGHVRLQDLEAGHVERMYAALRADNARRAREGQRAAGPATLKRVHATLMSALNTAVRKRLLPYNPGEHVELEAADRPEVEPWSVKDLGAFLDAAGADRLGPMYELVAFAGLRRGEAVGLRWCDVDLERRVVHVRQEIIDVGGTLILDRPKTKGSEGQVDIDAHTVGSLLEHQLRQHSERTAWAGARTDWRQPFLEHPERIGLPERRMLPTCRRPGCPHGLVFCRENGAALRPEYVTRRLQAIAGDAGLPVKRLHDLRHGAASLQIAAGVDLAIVSKRLRHSSVSITADTYTHLLEGVGQAAAEAASALVPRTRRAYPRADEDTSCTPGVRDDQGRRTASEKSQVSGGGPPGDRTLNPRIKSPLLCQLS